MRATISNFIRSCSVCQQAKVEHSKPAGLLQPLPVPQQAWKVVSMDFIEGLPSSHGYNCILVVVDLFSKYGHFLPLKHPFTARSVAQSFLSQVYKLHGMPQAIVSDRDKIFTSHFWRELFQLAGIELRMSTAYHPQTDGQTERVNQCLETFLRCFVHACPHQWRQWLDQAEFWYNTNWHSALGRSPFEVLYGYAPRQFGVSTHPDTPITDLATWLSDRALMSEVILQHLNLAKQRMKKQADEHRSERQFQLGDLVFVKLQPYVQSSLAHRSNQKLAFKFFGPYRILARVGHVAYRLELPASSSVHPVFHVSQLKKSVGKSHSVTSHPPSEVILWSVPERILQTRSINKGTRSITQGFVLWSNLPRSLATWEDLEFLRQQFPRAAVWDRLGAQGRGGVTTGPAPVTSPAMDAEDGRELLAEDGLKTQEMNGPQLRRSSRPRVANRRVTGAEWAKP